jgi:proprotein convertase subtilisin/kexin type 5
VCHYSCETCESPSKSSCTACTVNSSRTLSPLKECLCNQRFIDVANDKICAKCHYSCLTCSSPVDDTKCITCSPADNRALDESNGKCACLVGFFDVANANKCNPCHYSCKECTGGDTLDKCTACSKDNNR